MVCAVAAAFVLLFLTGCDNADLTESWAEHAFATKTSAPEDTSAPDCVPSCTGNKVCVDGTCQDIGLVWVPIPGGDFQMGCVPGDADCADNEKPQHPVTISAFDMLETEVTEAQYFAVTGEDPSYDYNGGGGDNSPVENVTWFEAKAFCEAIGGRLPTEAEWEYAARAGGTTKYICGAESTCLGDHAWYSSNSDDGPGEHKHDVKEKLPNDFGLYDMSGNVWEWVADWYDSDYYDVSIENNPKGPNTGSFRVRRGGSFGSYDSYYFLRVSSRNFYDPSDDYGLLGIRCARSE